MNRHERRAASSSKGRKRIERLRIPLSQFDSMFDIQIDAKFEQTVMIYANPKGRKVVEDLWPDVQWTTDEIFSSAHSPEWLFTHIRVTRLSPHLEAKVPLAFCVPDALGFAVAVALQRRTEPRRVAYFTGTPGVDFEVNVFGEAFDNEPGADVALFAEYLPPGPIGVPEMRH